MFDLYRCYNFILNRNAFTDCFNFDILIYVFLWYSGYYVHNLEHFFDKYLYSSDFDVRDFDVLNLISHSSATVEVWRDDKSKDW